MQKNKGITLVALVITIIVLLIIAGVSVGVLFGDNGILTKAQEAANRDYLESTKEEIKLQIAEEIASNEGTFPTNEVLKSILEKYGQVEYEVDGTTVKGVITTEKGYEILLSDLGTLNTSSVETPDTVNISYEVKGVTGSTYNILVKISDPNGIETIVYKNSSGTDVTLTCENNLEVAIDYAANPDIEYYFTVKAVGQTERVKKILVEKATTIIADGGWDGTVNSPKLAQGMTGIYWDDSQNEVTVTADNQGNWYDYANKKWANAKTQDGSYWVWIPRYEYKIPSPHTSTAQTINVSFIQDTNTTVDSGYTMHPGFTFGTTELTGIWVAKFEASGSTSAVDVKPNVSSLRSITIDAMFTACRNIETNTRYGWGTTGTGIDSHLMKNVEWGACAYLSSSQYGKIGEVWINPNSNYITGQAGTSVSASSTTSTYAYNNVTYGVNASTTGNIYGIYDMSGGAWEYTAAYVNNGNSSLTAYGLSLVNADVKYKDVYTSSGDTGAGNYGAASSGKGDAVYETSLSDTGSTSWYSDYSYMPNSSNPLFLFGGLYSRTTDAGAFSFAYENGRANSFFGFHLVLVLAGAL